MSETIVAQNRKYDTSGSTEGGAGGSGEGGVTDILESPDIRRLMESDASTTVLLGRLKSSLLTCVEFTKFIRKKYMLEEGHAIEMGKVYKSFFQGTGDSGLQKGIHQVLEYDGRLSKVKLSYVSALQKIHDELSNLLAIITKSRKNLKEHSRRLEKEVSDAIHSAEKAKSRYFSFCQDREKLRLVDPAKTKLTLRGSKTTREQEEELQRKIDNADLEYKQKVDHSTSLRNTYINKERPRIVSELRDLILELDTAMAIQLQKYTIWTENLILNSGVTVIPLEGNGQSMKDHASAMDNKADLCNYLTKLSKSGLSVNKNLIPVDYKKHPSMAKQLKQVSGGEGASHHSGASFAVNPQNNSLPKRVLSTSMETPFNTVPSPVVPSGGANAMGISSTSPPMNTAGRQDGTRSMLDVLDRSQQKNFNTLDPGQKTPGPQETSLVNSITRSLTAESSLGGDQNHSTPHGAMKATRTFGVPLDQLLEFEQDMVPAIVRQCLYVVDKYGLQLEGIYRRSANVLEVSKLREEIDKDPSNISMLLPSKNYTESDIYLVGSLLKAFFASLPDSLLPKSLSPEIRTCLSIENPVTRKNFMHGLIYKLPDGQYWTLRALIFHLKRVLEHEQQNRMNVKSLCIIWGPTIVPQNQDDETDVNFQIRSMEVLFDVADQAFEPE